MEYILLLLIGVCVGSFLNVVIDRLPQGESIVVGRSHCDRCKHVLAWYDLFPVLSFLFLRGRCRYCGKKLSLQYPLIELLTGGIFLSVFVFGSYALTWEGISAMLLGFGVASSFIVLGMIDIKYGILPDKVILFGTLLVFLNLLFHPQALLFHLLTGLCYSVFFLLIYVFTRGKGMGFGDVKLAFFLGMFLGFPHVLTAAYVAFLTGAIVAIILVLIGKRKFHGGAIPFGPFLIFGTVVGYYFGNVIWNYFLSFF